ncbi:hypothetical protein LguiA_002047 [Lonicera macranthoides]
MSDLKMRERPDTRRQGDAALSERLKKYETKGYLNKLRKVLFRFTSLAKRKDGVGPGLRKGWRWLQVSRDLRKEWRWLPNLPVPDVGIGLPVRADIGSHLFNQATSEIFNTATANAFNQQNISIVSLEYHPDLTSLSPLSDNTAPQSQPSTDQATTSPALRLGDSLRPQPQATGDSATHSASIEHRPGDHLSGSPSRRLTQPQATGDSATHSGCKYVLGFLMLNLRGNGF